MKINGSIVSGGNSGNTKRIPSSKRWTFTTKYINGSISLMNEILMDSKFKCAICSLEEGDKGGYLHWQGYVEYKRKDRPFGVNKFTITPDTHWEKSKGSKVDNIKYCTKNPYLDIIINNNVYVPREIFKLKYQDLYDWQKLIVNKYKGFAPPFNRKIDWYWESTGNRGKSILAKYFVDFNDAIVVSGKATDIFYNMKFIVDKRGDGPKMVILDIPRSMIDYISYQAIEKILDGLLFSGKYEGGMIRFNVPWVVCFANQRPDRSTMSLDRWNIIKL